MAYNIFRDASRQNVCKAGPAMGSHCDQVGIDAISEVNNTFFLAYIVKHIERKIFQLQFFRKILHVFFHHNIALKITWRIDSNQVYRGVIELLRCSHNP